MKLRYLFVLAILLIGTRAPAQTIPAATGWFEIPNTKIQPLCPNYPEIQGGAGCAGVMSAWGGGLMDTNRNWMIVHGGGHVDYSGNEIYALDLNTMAWFLMKDSTHNPNLNAASCPDSYLDGNPVSVHTYSGLAYLPIQDKYVRQGGSKANCGSFTDSTWLFDPTANHTLHPAGNTWTKLTTNTHEGSSGSPGAIAYDPTTQKIYEGVHNTGDFVTYDPAASTWTTLGTFTLPCNVGTQHSAAIDVGRRLYFCIGSGAFDKVSLNSPYTVTHLAATATGCSTLTNNGAPGFVYDPDQQLMVGWAGGTTVYTYNADTNTCTPTTFAASGACPTTAQPNGTHGRFQYSRQLGVFILVNAWNTNACSLRMVSQPSVLSDFTTRCNAPGVLKCVGWDIGSDFTPASGGGGYADGLYPTGSDNSIQGTQDTTIKTSGAGALKFTIRAGSTIPFVGVPAGYWVSNFGPLPTPTKFGNGTTLYLQFRLRVDAPMLTFDWDGTTGANGWKSFIVFGPIPGPSCTNTQFVQENTNQSGVLTGYTSCGAPALYSSQGTPLLIEQGDFNCQYNGAGAPVYAADPKCFKYVADTWITEYWVVQIGSLGQPNTRFQGWAGLPGQGLKKFIDLPNYTFSSTGEGAAGNGLQEIQLVPYFTSAGSSTATPLAHMWFDELIVSTQPIAPVGGSAAAVGAPVATLSTSSINFFNQLVSTTTSIQQTAVLSNTGTATLTISSNVMGGTNAADFGFTTNCGASLGAGNSCNYNFTFSPSATGARSATFSITDNAAGSPHVVALAGTGARVVSGQGSISGTGTIKVNP